MYVHGGERFFLTFHTTPRSHTCKCHARLNLLLLKSGAVRKLGTLSDTIMAPVQIWRLFELFPTVRSCTSKDATAVLTVLRRRKMATSFGRCPSSGDASGSHRIYAVCFGVCQAFVLAKEWCSGSRAISWSI